MSVPSPVFTYVSGSAGIAGTVIAAGYAAYAIVEKIIGDDNAKREAFTKNFVDQFSQAHPDHNVVIVHTAHTVGGEYTHMHHELPMTVGTCGYEIYASHKGRPFTLTLTGDGGYINWAFEGEFNRNFGTIRAVEHA